MAALAECWLRTPPAEQKQSEVLYDEYTDSIAQLPYEDKHNFLTYLKQHRSEVYNTSPAPR